MKIKIGEKIYSSEKDIIVLRLTEYEKELIGNMGEQEYFCIAPPNSKREGLSEAINSAKACMHITDKFDEMKEKNESKKPPKPTRITDPGLYDPFH